MKKPKELTVRVLNQPSRESLIAALLLARELFVRERLAEAKKILGNNDEEQRNEQPTSGN